MISPFGYGLLWRLAIRDQPPLKAAELAKRVSLGRFGSVSTQDTVNHLKNLKGFGLVVYRSGQWTISERGRKWLEAAGDE